MLFYSEELNSAIGKIKSALSNARCSQHKGRLSALKWKNFFPDIQKEIFRIAFENSVKNSFRC